MYKKTNLYKHTNEEQRLDDCPSLTATEWLASKRITWGKPELDANYSAEAKWQIHDAK